MRIFTFVVGVLMVAMASAQAADVSILRKGAAAPPATVYRVIPRSPEAQLVWAADACWRGCAQDCGLHLPACLAIDSSGNCIARNDSCDRFCQTQCRQYGGPLLPFD